MFVREAERRRIVDLAARGRSVRVVGPRWSGRSELLRAVEQRLREDGRDVYVVSAAAGVPDLEVLRFSLPPRVRCRLDGRELAFGAVYDLVNAHLAESPHVVLVDDADLLDEASRGVIALLHRQHRFPIVATALRGGGDHAVAWPAGTVEPVVEIGLPGLSPDRLHTLLVARAGGAVSSRLSARIHGDSAGIPGLGLAMLEGAIGHGAVRQVDGVWTGEDVWSPEMQGVYAAYLASYPAAVRDAVDLLAVGGAMSIPLALRALGADVLELLEHDELVRAVPAGADQLVVLHPPGLADVVERGGLTARRRRVLSEALARIADPRSILDEDSARLAGRLRERLQPGPDLPTPRRSARAQGEEFVGRLFSQHRALELTAAVRAWDGDKRVVHAARVLRLLLSGSGDPELAATVVRETDLGTDRDTFDYVELCAYRARCAVLRGATGGEAARELERAGAAGVRYRESLSSLAHVLRAELDGLDPSYEDVLAPRTAAPGHDGQTARVALAACRLIDGEHAAALDLLADRETWPALLRDSADLLVGLALHGIGRFADGLAHGRALALRARARLDGAAYVSGCVVVALCLGSRLELGAARRELFSVLSSGASALALVLPPDRAARVLLTSLSRFGGRQTVPVELLDLAGEDQGCGEALPFSSAPWIAAAEQYVGGDLDGLARTLDDLAERLRERGFRFAADATRLHRLVLRYDAEAAADFAGSADRLGGALYRTYLEVKRALHDRDPDRLVAVAARLLELDVPAQALRCYVSAAAMYQAEGATAAAADARAAAHRLRSDDTASRTGELDLRLTGREREIARLVAQGESNIAIADRLFLSRRTVESHLRNIRRKTGAADRDAIARLEQGTVPADGWLAGT